MSDAHTSGPRLVLSTCPGGEEARRIARGLIEARLAACVSVLPGMHSTYRWQGKIEEAEEVLLLIKTGAAQVDSVEKLIASLHSYQVPEFLVLEIVGGSESYLQWLSGALK